MPEADRLRRKRGELALATPTFCLVLKPNRIAYAEDVDEHVACDQQARPLPQERYLTGTMSRGVDDLQTTGKR